MRRRRIAIFDKLSSFIRSLPPSDKAIAALLGLLFAGACVTGLYALERSFLVAVPAHGGTLTEGIVGSPRFVNPLLAFTDADRDLTTLTYAGLMGVGPDGLRPILAESYTISPDGRVYTFILRKDAQFSDGTPVTAQDVVFTIQKAQDPALKSPELSNWANVTAEAVDARTVRFTLPKAYAPFLTDTTLGILPSHLWKSVSDEEFPFTKLMSEPVGAGPFKVSHISRDKTGTITGYTLSAFSRYALGKPYLNGFTFHFYASVEDLGTAYKQGGVESAYGIATPSALRSPYSRVFAVFFNQEEDKALGELAVRKALSIAIDRNHLVGTTLGGYATPLTGPVPPGSGITEPAQVQGDLVALAKQTLTDGGWSYSTTTSAWSNKKLKLTLGPITLSTSNVPELKTLAGEVQADWQAIGVASSLELYDPTSLTTTVIRPRKYDTLYFGMVVGHDEDLFAFWDSSQKNDPGLNIARYQNTTVDTLLEKARSESDPAQHAADLQKISDAIAADYPAAFTHSPDFLYSVPKDLVGVQLPQITSPSDRFANVESWHRYTEWVWPFLAPNQ